MTADFDRLTARVAETAERLRAFGYLNSAQRESDGAAAGYEVRFQPNPIHALWRERRFGWSQRFRSLDEVGAFLDVVDRAAAAESAGIGANDDDALGRVLRIGEEYRRHV